MLTSSGNAPCDRDSLNGKRFGFAENGAQLNLHGLRGIAAAKQDDPFLDPKGIQSLANLFVGKMFALEASDSRAESQPRFKGI